jgi:anti-sigma factor RsiW
MRGRKSRRGARSLPCDAVRSAISAGLDGERPGLSRATVTAHVGDCRGCARYEEGVRAIREQMSLRASRRPPEALKALLARELATTVASTPPPLERRSRRGIPSPGWRRTARWAAALLPAAALTVALPLGALSAAQGKPTHAPTPCTQNLRSPRASAP